jgi:hypothetical protein
MLEIAITFYLNIYFFSTFLPRVFY